MTYHRASTGIAKDEAITAAIDYDVPKHITRSAEDVVTDYLSHVARAWALYMKGRGKNTLKQVALDVVILHPAVSFLLNPHKALMLTPE